MKCTFCSKKASAIKNRVPCCTSHYVAYMQGYMTGKMEMFEKYESEYLRQLQADVRDVLRREEE